jgi:hypothetical protein
MQRHFKGLASAIRTEQYQGREHLVVPVIALVEGVVHAMNAAGPEFVSADEFPSGWDGMPVFLGHPMRNGRPVSGNSTEVLKSSVGTIFNSGVKDKKLTMEAWVDVARADATLLKRLRASDPIEVSIGAFVETDTSTGEYNGKTYKGAWHNMTPDHLALLPEGHVGACSMDMGCGVRAASNPEGINQYTQGGVFYHGTSRANAASIAKNGIEPRKGTGHEGEKVFISDDIKIAKAYADDPSGGYGHVIEIHVPADAGFTAEQVQGRQKGFLSTTQAIPKEWIKAVHGTTVKGGKKTFGKIKSLEEYEVKNMYEEWLEDGSDELIRTLRDIPVEERAKLSAADFAGPNRSFPISIAEDVSAAASALGRAKGNRDAIKKKIIAIAYRKGLEASLPDDWQKKKDQKNASFFSRIMDAFRSAQPANKMGTNDLRRKLSEALREKEPSIMYCSIEDYYPVTDPTHVVYTCYDQNMSGGSYALYERAFTLDADGVVTMSDSKIEVEPVMMYEPVEGASPITAELKQKDAESGAPCSCHNNPPNREIAMKKEDLVKFLEKATDEQIAALSIVAEGKPATPAAPVVAEKVAEKIVETKVAETPKVQTFEEMLATATPELRDSINEGLRVGREKKAATIKTLKDSKRCVYTDDELNAMPQAQLDKLVTLADIKVAVDFSGQGLPKSDAPLAVPAPVDMNARICAAVKK